MVAGLPRGGVPLARIVADALNAELDVCLVRKVGVPWQPELALGALAEGGIRVLDSELIRECGLEQADIERLAAAAQAEIDKRGKLYRGSRMVRPQQPLRAVRHVFMSECVGAGRVQDRAPRLQVRHPVIQRRGLPYP